MLWRKKEENAHTHETYLKLLRNFCCRNTARNNCSLRHVRLSTSLSRCHKSSPTEWIFMKFYSRDSYQTCRPNLVLDKIGKKNYGHFLWAYAYIYVDNALFIHNWKKYGRNRKTNKSLTQHNLTPLRYLVIRENNIKK
jgi:hypothetical protein